MYSTLSNLHTCIKLPFQFLYCCLIVFLSVTDSICISSHMVNTPCQIVWILEGRKQTGWGVSEPNTLGPWYPLFTHQHPAQTGLPQSQTTVSNLSRSVPSFLWLLLLPSRPQPRAKSSTYIMQIHQAGGQCAVCAVNLAVNRGAMMRAWS